MAKYGYPIVIGIEANPLATALACPCREARTWTDGTVSPDIAANRMIPRLLTVAVKDGVVTGVFEVASGGLQLAGNGVQRYEVSGPLTARRVGQKIHIEPDGKGSFVCASGGARANLDAKQARQLGLAGDVAIDCSPLRIGDWQLQPRGVPGFRGEGDGCYVGVDVDPQRNGGSFLFSPALRIRSADLKGLPPTLSASGFGVLVDEDLVPLLVDTIERRMNGRSDFRRVRVVPQSMDGAGDFQVTGSGDIFRLGGWKAFTFSARAWLQLANDRIEVAYEVTDAWHGSLWVLPLMGDGDKMDQFDSGFPRRWGNDALPLGRREITGLGGKGATLELQGTASPVPCDNAEIQIDPQPGRRLFVHRGKARRLELRNLAAATTRRRASLRVIEPRVEKLPGGWSANDFEILPTEQALAAATAGILSIEYTGSGDVKGELVVPTNDGELRYPLEAAEQEGHLGLIAIVNIRGSATRTNTGQWLVPDGFARFWITHQSGSSVRFSVQTTGVRLSLAPAGDGEVSRTRPADERTVVFHGGGSQLTRNPQTGRYELRASGEVTVTTTGGAVHKIQVLVHIEEGASIAGDPWWAEYFMRNSREIRALLPEVDAGWLRKYLVDLGTPSFEEPDIFPPPRPCGFEHADWQTWRFPADVDARWTREGNPVAEIEPEATACVVPTRGEGRLEVREDVEELRICVARHGEVLLTRQELGQVNGLAWSGETLHVAGEAGLLRFRVVSHGHLVPLEPVAEQATALLGMGDQLLVAKGPILETWLSHADSEARAVGETQLDVHIRSLAALADGRIAAAGDGRLTVLHTAELEPLNGASSDVVPDPAGGHSLLAAGPWLLSFGEGIALFAAGDVPELVEHWPLGEARGAVLLDGVALVATSEGVFTLDLDADRPTLAARVDWAEVPEDSLLHNRGWAFSDGHLVASIAEAGRVDLHAFVRFGIEPQSWRDLHSAWVEQPGSQVLVPVSP